MADTITTVIGDGPTRTELLNQLAHRLNKNPPPLMDPATEARLASYLNQRQRRLVTMPGLKRLRDATLTFLTAPGQADYGLPAISKPSRIWETTTDTTLYELGQQDYRLISPNPATIQGTPEAFVWTGRQAVAMQPTAPTSLFLSSSNVSDVLPVAYVQGQGDHGHLLSVSMTLNGATAVEVSAGLPLWTRVDKFYLSEACRGDITLTDGSTPPVPLAFIPAGHLTSVYTGLTLYPTPGEALTYSMDITRPVTDLVTGNDQAAIPDEFSDLLVLGALADEFQHLSDPRWSAAVNEYKERENQLKYWLAETAIGRPFGLTRTWHRPSQLGPMFPAGS